MDEPIVSGFDSAYYFRTICGTAFFLWMPFHRLYQCLTVDLANPVSAYLYTLIWFGALWVYYYFFSKSWKRITVTATEIIVRDIVFKKQITIPYADITGVNTYRTQGYGGRLGAVFSQSFVIEYKGDQSVSFNKGWYSNYNKLTMAIYNHKYGPGHGRERYLARH